MIDIHLDKGQKSEVVTSANLIDMRAKKALETATEAINAVFEEDVARFRELANEAGLRIVPDFAPLTLPRRR